MSGWRREGRVISLPLPTSTRCFLQMPTSLATMANKINERGQISGMAIVLSRPEKGNIHAFLATPVNASIGKSVAEVAPTRLKSNVPANAGEQPLRRFGLVRFGQ